VAGPLGVVDILLIRLLFVVTGVLAEKVLVFQLETNAMLRLNCCIRDGMPVSLIKGLRLLCSRLATPSDRAQLVSSCLLGCTLADASNDLSLLKSVLRSSWQNSVDVILECFLIGVQHLLHLGR